MDHKCEDLIRHLVIPLHLDGCLGFIVIIASFLTDLLVHDSFVLPTHPTILPIPVACYPVAPFFLSPRLSLLSQAFFSSVPPQCCSLRLGTCTLVTFRVFVMFVEPPHTRF